MLIKVRQFRRQVADAALCHDVVHCCTQPVIFLLHLRLDAECRAAIGFERPCLLYEGEDTGGKVGIFGVVQLRQSDILYFTICFILEKDLK